MEKLFSSNTLWLFSLIVVPGYFMRLVWCLYFPTERKNLTKDFLSILVWGLVSHLLIAAFFPDIYDFKVVEKSTTLRLAGICGVFILPFLLARLGVWVRNQFDEFLPSTPWNRSWDFYFGNSPDCIVMVHLKSGTVIAGVWNRASHATRFPDPQEIYLCYQIQVKNENDTFSLGEYVKGTRGVWVPTSEIALMEFFDLKKSESETKPSDTETPSQEK